MQPQQHTMQGIGMRAIIIGLFKVFVWSWKLASFTGAWVFLVPIVIASNFGTSLLTTILLAACLLFCIFWTRKNWRSRKQMQAAPPRSPREEDIWR